MTIVCCWYDNSYNRPRLTAIADSRAATKDEKTGKWTPLNTVTTKLFKVRVLCYEMSNLDLANGAWVNPYFITEIGIGYAGGCFEAMSIIALYQRALEQIVAIDDGVAQPTPEPHKLLDWLVQIANAWVGNNSRPAPAVQFLAFGISPSDGSPWIGNISPKDGAAAALVEYADSTNQQMLDGVFWIGDGLEKQTLNDTISTIPACIKSHAKNLPTGTTADDQVARELEFAKHMVAEKKLVEEIVLKAIADEGIPTVGGLLSKLEVVPCGNNRGLATFSKNDGENIIGELPPLGPHLFYVPIGETMGRCNSLGGPVLWDPDSKYIVSEIEYT